MHEGPTEIKLKELIGIAIGEASMCWNPRPGSQIFDSTHASSIVDRLTCDILDIIGERLSQLENQYDEKDKAHHELCDRYHRHSKRVVKLEQEKNKLESRIKELEDLVMDTEVCAYESSKKFYPTAWDEQEVKIPGYHDNPTGCGYCGESGEIVYIDKHSNGLDIPVCKTCRLGKG